MLGFSFKKLLRWCLHFVNTKAPRMKIFILTVMISAMWMMSLHTSAQVGKSAADLVKEARAQVENLTPLQVKSEMEKGGVTIIDIRELDELIKDGIIPGSIHAPRGMLEFYADAKMPYYKAVFKKDARIILQCASGGRSALAALVLKQMGYTQVAHLDGGLKAWNNAGLPVNAFQK